MGKSLRLCTGLFVNWKALQISYFRSEAKNYLYQLAKEYS